MGIEDQVQDDALLLYGDADAAATELRSLGVDRIRVTAGWATIAPAPHSRRRPSFDATDPGAYPAAPGTSSTARSPRSPATA